MTESFSKKDADSQAATLLTIDSRTDPNDNFIEKRSHHRYFPVNLVKLEHLQRITSAQAINIKNILKSV